MRRYRLGQLAAIVNMVAVVVAVVVSLVRDSLDPAWTVVQWYPPSRFADETSLLAVLGGLLLVGAVNSWMFWQVLQGPADAAPLPRRALWLRRLLYVYVGWLLIPVPLPDEVETAFDVVLWVLIVILFAQVLTRSGPTFRLILVTTALLSTVLPWVLEAVPPDNYADWAAPVLPAVSLALVAAGLAWFLMILIAQRRDGRWRRTTMVLCPEVVARDHPDLLLTAAQLKQRDAKERARRRQEVADEAAQYVSGCRDPWPALRTSRQVTAVHLPTDWDGYHIFDGRAASLETLDAENIESDSPLVAHGGAARVGTTLEYGATCVTVKVLRTAPPIRRRGWDDVVDADLVLGSGRVHLKGRGIKVAVALPKAGKYRVRLHTRTLDEGVGEDLVVVFPTS
ncbi:hypothetical protein [Streptosporangium subroseum]|nr:hypothetical protein OHB15_47300 [Streptosporangium subroseum]